VGSQGCVLVILPVVTATILDDLEKCVWRCKSPKIGVGACGAVSIKRGGYSVGAYTQL
jgi:hypothetical protein